jgi:hypothetical protein
MFRQADLSQFFLLNSGPFKRQNEQRTQYFRDYGKSKCSRQFLKEWKQNRPWLVDTETVMVCSYCKGKKMEIHLLQDVQATNIHTICQALNRPEI